MPRAMRGTDALARPILALAYVSILACSSPAPATTSAASTPARAAAPPPTAAAARQAYAPTPLSPPVTLKVGLVGGTSDAGIFIAIEQGHFAQEGLQVETEIVPNTSTMVGALAAGQLDALGPPIAASIFNAAAREVPMRMVADKGSTPSAEWDFVSLMVRKDLVDAGQVRDYRDLKGLTIALAGQATAPEIEVAKALEKGGLTLADGNITVGSLPDMNAALPNKAIDPALVSESPVSRTMAQRTAVRRPRG